jgi:CubicO group peptidase (beta-lactamase class C family)
MQLWEQGKFQLDDPLYHYLPAYKEMTVQTEDGVRKAQTPIRIKNLFTMTAGFPYNYKSDALMALRERESMPTTRQVIDALAQDPLVFEPADQYRYSLCHDVLGALIEEVSGELLQDYVKNHIFDPLGMTQTCYQPGGEPLADLAPLYRFHKDTGDRVLQPALDRVGPCFVSGGGGCISTAEDYMKFAEALRTGERLLKQQTIDLIAQDHLTERQKRTYTLKNMNYGLGMWSPKPGQQRQDIGWGGAGGVLLAVDRSRGLSFVYMQHMLNSPNQGLRGKLIRTFLTELEGTAPAEQDNMDYKKYSLTY